MYRNRSGPSLNNYRTKLCINFKNGHCPYGDKCRFIHQQSSFFFYSKQLSLIDG